MLHGKRCEETEKKDQETQIPKIENEDAP